eukprot:scaffold96157_cov57-Phaeocystis_antarctica.AAC.3
MISPSSRPGCSLAWWLRARADSTTPYSLAAPSEESAALRLGAARGGINSNLNTNLFSTGLQCDLPAHGYESELSLCVSLRFRFSVFPVFTDTFSGRHVLHTTP